MKKKVRETKTVSYAKEEIPMLKTGLTLGAIGLTAYIGWKLFGGKLMALGSEGGGSPAQPFTPYRGEEPIERPAQYIPERPAQYIPERPLEPVQRPASSGIAVATDTNWGEVFAPIQTAQGDRYLPSAVAHFEAGHLQNAPVEMGQHLPVISRGNGGGYEFYFPGY